MAKSPSTYTADATLETTVPSTTSATEHAEVTSTAVPTEDTASADQAPPAPRWRDKGYMSRVLILPSGATARVARGEITGDTDELREYLAAQVDEFERIEG